MKVICDRGALVDALNLVGGVIPNRTPKPVLQCVHLTAANGTLTLAGTDMEVAIRISTDKVEVQEEGEALIPADKLSQICRESSDSTLTFDVGKDEAHIRGQDAKFTIYTYPANEFPPMPDAASLDPDFSVDAGQLHTLIERTRFATARENSRYAINGVLVTRTGKKLEVVATDGRRLALAKGSCISAAEGDSQYIIPSKAVALLVKLSADSAAKVSVYLTDSQVIFLIGDEGDQAMLATNLVEGSFPPYQDVLPKDLDKKVSFDLPTLDSAVRRAALLTNDESKGVRLVFSGGGLTITSRAPELGEAEINVSLAKYEGDDVEIGFNPQYITDALKVIDGAEVVLELKAPNKPGMIKSGSDFLYVIMPVSLS